MHLFQIVATFQLGSVHLYVDETIGFIWNEFCLKNSKAMFKVNITL